MGWMSLRFVKSLYLTAVILFVRVSETKNTLKVGLSRVPQLHKWRVKKPSILGEPTAICHCSYQNYMQLKSRNILQRADIFSLKKSHAAKRTFHRDLIYAPMCCKIDLSDPNKLYRYPLSVRLTEKAFNEYLNDPNSSEFKALASELTNAVNQLFPGDSALVSVEVSAFRSGSVIADLILTTKGIFPQAMYDALKMAIESGLLGQVKVALEPIVVPTPSPSSTPVPTIEPPTAPEILPVPTQPSVTAPPVGVTPGPSEVQPTQPPVTAVPIGVTSGPSEVQPTQPSVTAPPVGVTPGPSEVQPTQPPVTAVPIGVTSGPSEVQPTQPSVTAPPIGVTPGPSEVQPTQPPVTAVPIGVTSGPSEVQPTQPSVTAPPVGVTPGPSEVQPTQPPVTAVPIGVTSGPSEVQPTQPSVTAPPIGVTSGPSEVQPTQPPSGGTTGSTTKAEFEKECLCSHNQKRKAHGTPLMTWSADIAASATVWAKNLAARDMFEHDKSNSLYGENLYMEWGKSSAKGLCLFAVDKWYDEIEYYDFNTPGFKSETGHFTQVVWKKSIKLGVGEGTSSSGKRYVVARYEERGNVVGYFAENVPPPVSGTPAGPSKECGTGGGETPPGGQEQPSVTESPSSPSGGVNPPTPIPSATGQTPAVPEQGSIITPTNAPTGAVPINPLIPGQSTPKPSEAVIPAVTPNPAIPGQSTPKPSEAVIPPVTPNPAIPGQSTPKPSEAVIPGVTPNPLIPGQSTPKPSEAVIPGVTPNPLIPGQSTPKPSEAVIPPVTTNPAIPGQSTPKPSEAVIPGVTPNPLILGHSTPKPSEAVIPPVTTNPAIPGQSTPRPGEALIPTTGAVTPNPLVTAPPAGGATPLPVPGIVTPSPITTGATLPAGAELPPATPPAVTPPPGTEGGMPTIPSETSPSAGVAPKPNEPSDPRPSTPYDPSTSAQLIKAVIRLIEKAFSPDLANPGTAAYQQLKADIENAIRAAFENADTLRSVTATNFKASEGKHLRNVISKSVRRAPVGVDVEVELFFRENKPDQLKPLEQQLATGMLGAYRVLPSMSAVIIRTYGASCPELCMGPTICQPQCPTQCCQSTKPTVCPSSCSNACSPGCTRTCCSFGTKVQNPHLLKVGIHKI